MPDPKDELLPLIRLAIAPSSNEVFKAKQVILRVLTDGEPHTTDELLDLLRMDEAPSSQRDALIAAARGNIEAAVTPEHPAISYNRLRLAAAEALGDLVGQGLIIESQLDQREGIAIQKSIDFKYAISSGPGSRSEGHLQVLSKAPRLPLSGYRLRYGVRNEPTRLPLLDPSLFSEGLSALKLAASATRCLEEGLAAHRAGLYLAATSLLGAYVEAAWYAVAEIMKPVHRSLAKALTDGSTARIQRGVYESLKGTPDVGSEADDLLSFASLVRTIRNYGVHPTSVDATSETYFTEAGSGLLIMKVHHHVHALNRAVGRWNEEHGAVTT